MGSSSAGLAAGPRLGKFPNYYPWVRPCQGAVQARPENTPKPGGIEQVPPGASNRSATAGAELGNGDQGGAAEQEDGGEDDQPAAAEAGVGERGGGGGGGGRRGDHGGRG